MAASATERLPLTPPPVSIPVGLPIAPPPAVPELGNPAVAAEADDKVTPLPAAEDDAVPGLIVQNDADPTRGGMTSEAGPADLVARTTSPSRELPMIQPRDVRRDLDYPDTGLPALGPGGMEPERPRADTVLESDLSGAAPPAEEKTASESLTWEVPESLLSRLDGLTAHAATRRWAAETAELVRQFGPALSTGSPEATALLERLESLNKAATPLVASLKDRSLAQDLSRAGHALDRRLGVWKQIGKSKSAWAAKPSGPKVTPESMMVCLSDFELLTRDSEEGKAWRKYLLVDSLRSWAARGPSAEERLPSEVSRQLLKRLCQTGMSPGQRQFTASGPVAALQAELLRHAAEPISAARLLRHLEGYERSGLPSDARLLAEDCQYLALAPEEEHRLLGQRVESHYRNANVRVAVSAELLNRMIPKRPAEYAPVYDTVLGLPVRGESLTSSSLAIRLQPDPRRVRLALEITGEVAALTASTSGPATFVTDTDSTYVARKPLEIDLKGIRLWPTEVDVQNDMRLRRIRTDFDGLPLVSSLVRGVARNQHDQKQPQADAEVREKMAAQAKERIDKETSEQIKLAARKLHQSVLGPMNSLALDPTLVAAETTAERFIMRVRLAGKDQLGSHTPRPQAPANSLASVQVHETALNNVVQRLELDGRTFSLPELGRHLAKRLDRRQAARTSEDDEDVTIAFAEKDAVRLRCVEDRLEITLSVARLSKAARKWKEFQVRAYYRPVVAGRSVELHRDGVVQLIGRLNTGSQLTLRGVFAKTFSQKAPWKITPDSFANDPRLADLAITQFTIDDGWVGAALGPAPRRTVVRPGLLRR